MIDETPFNVLGISGPILRHQDSERGASDSDESECGVSSMEVVDLDKSSDIDNYVEVNSSNDDDIEIVDIAEAYLDTVYMRMNKNTTIINCYPLFYSNLTVV